MMGLQRHWAWTLAVWMGLLCCCLYSVQCQKQAKISMLNEDNWKQVMEGEWMVEFFAPWCPACRALHSTWAEFSEWSDDLGLDGVAQVDVTENPGLSGRFMVTALPTIYHVKDGEFRQYRGPRDKDSFISFIEDKKFEDLEAVPSWKHPNSVQMTLVSYFFKMSMLLRNVHQLITEDYGYPAWVSYACFATATILFGAILGLILVLCVDCCFPYNKHQTRPITITQSKKNDEPTLDDAADEQDEEEEEEEEEEEKPEEQKEVQVRKRRAKKAD